MKHAPTFEYEHLYWQQDIAQIAGIDEAGMGALAGPVVAAAVILPPDFSVPGVRDSKTLSVRQRELLVVAIQQQALAWAVGQASVAEITTLNIRRAAHLAMQRAVDQLLPQPLLLLVDGNPCQPHPTIPASTLVKGDICSTSIAAASIVAKVHRDQIMVKLDQEWPQYGFAQHKGYGSQAHLAALATHGACSHHRPTYAPVAHLLTPASEVS
ncbi:MAG: ribonuclease HII [Candidatus Andersenbacteria bacterium]